MSEPRTLLDELLAAWAYTRAGVTAELEAVPDDRLGFRPTEVSRSVAELVIHIVESGRMMAGELSRPDGDFARQSYEEHIREHSGTPPRDQPKRALLELLRSSGEAGLEALATVGEVAMLQRIRQFNGEYATRLSWLHHGIEHESYHRGQLALYVRLMGGVPALTRAIQGA